MNLICLPNDKSASSVVCGAKSTRSICEVLGSGLAGMQRVEVKMVQDQSAYAKQADINFNIGLVVGSKDEQEQTHNTKIMSINQNTRNRNRDIFLC